MDAEPRWKKELKQILYIALTFFILFVLFQLIKKALLAEYNIKYTAFGVALVGSLIIGKVVLLVDLLPLTKRLDYLPKVWGVFYRSFIYLAGYILLTLIEHSIKGLIKGDGFIEACKGAFHHLGERGFVASVIGLYIVFLFFNTFWILRNHYGPKELFNIYFKKEK
jgi:hypothetical protein